MFPSWEINKCISLFYWKYPQRRHTEPEPSTAQHSTLLRLGSIRSIGFSGHHCECDMRCMAWNMEDLSIGHLRLQQNWPFCQCAQDRRRNGILLEEVSVPSCCEMSNALKNQRSSWLVHRDGMHV